MRRLIGGLILAITLSGGAAFVAERADLPAAERADFIEVHGPDIAYVPMTETHVRYDGIVRRIAGFSAAVDNGQGNCACPNCCQGKCYVTIYTDLILPGGPIRTLYVLWMDC